MTQKSNWIEVDEHYWSESKSNAFNFDDFDDNINVLKNESIVKYDSNESSISTKNVTQTKGSELKLSEGLAQKQIQKCLNRIESEEKMVSNKIVSTKLSPKEAINCLVNGIDVNLSLYKGKDEKLALLDSAVESADGNAITPVVVYVKRSLKPSIFNHELRQRSSAADHYLFYLRQSQRINQLIDVLSMLGRHEDAAIAAYTQAISSANVETRIQNLKSCLRNHFTSGGTEVLFWSNHISEQILLLEQQLPIESDDRRQEQHLIGNQFEPIARKSLIDLSVISTLDYCCLYHYSLPENHFASPKAISKSYALTQKQFVWTAVSALAKSQRWTDIDSLFEYKSWLGNKRMKSCIAFEKVLSVLQKNEAPQEMLEKYLELIDDNEIRFRSAKELKLIKVAIDALIKSKDRKKLEEFSSKLDRNSDDYSYVRNALMAMKSKN